MPRHNSWLLNVAFCSDGDAGQILGIATIAAAICEECHRIGRPVHYWLVVPRTYQAFAYGKLYQLVGRENLTLLDVELSATDRYYVQLGLRRVFACVNGPSIVLCLDYDHAVMGSLTKLVSALPKETYCSSEVRTRCHPETAQLFSREPSMQYLNTSLIWGRSDALYEVGARWTEAYVELLPTVDRRFLTEYSFGLAACRSEIRVCPCTPKVQGNIANMQGHCCLFHYGGDSDFGIALKQELSALGSEFAKTKDSVDFVIEAGDYLTRAVRAFLDFGARS